MWLLTVKGLVAFLRTQPEYLSKRGEQNQRLFIDKCNWLLTEVVRRQYYTGEAQTYYQNIDSTRLKAFLGRDYKSFIDLLSKLHVIEVNDTYQAKSFSKSYRITQQALDRGIGRIEVFSERFANKLQAQFNDQLEELKTNRLYFKLLKNTSMLFMRDNKDYFIESIISEERSKAPTNEEDNTLDIDADKVIHRLDRHYEFFSTFQELNTSESPEELIKTTIFFEPKIGSTGRVYHLASSIPRLIRRCMLTKDGSTLFEVDMASAQPTILFLECIKDYLALKNHSSGNDAQINHMFDVLSVGGIYKHISEASSHFSNMEYDRMKTSILTALNAKDYPSKERDELEKIFPLFMSWVRNKKKKYGYKKISHIGQSAEAGIFIRMYLDLPDDIFALVIHDSILTVFENTELIHRLLIQRLYQAYPFLPTKRDLSNVFKITQVSL